MTKVMPCKCEHEYQDKRYGNGKRVFNLSGNTKSAVKDWRCTVCGNKKSEG